MSQQFPPHVDPELIAELKHYRKVAAMQLHDDVKIDLPGGARVKTEQGAWKVRWHKYLFVLGPSSKQGYEQQIALFNEPAEMYAQLCSITVTPVTFDLVRGVKRVTVIREVLAKSVDYALEVPGGYVDAGIIRRGLEWDESEWELFFPSIQLIKR